MKTVIIALSAACLFVAGPVFAQSVSSKAPRHEMRAKHRATHSGTYGYATHSGTYGYATQPGTYGYTTGMTQAKGPKNSPGAHTYAPTRDITDINTSGGGGGGGGY